MISLEFQSDVFLDKPKNEFYILKFFLFYLNFTIRKLSNAANIASWPNSTKHTAASNSKISALHL